MTELQDRLYREITRRTLLKAAGLGALSLSAAALLDACDIRGTSTANTGKITIGYVSPQTGEAAGFATGDNYVINGVRASSAYKNGFQVGGKGYDVEIVVKDTQSNPTRAAAVAQELINAGVDIVLCSSTPEVTNPVATLCEASGVPCVATIVPWEAWFFARQANPASPKPFTYTTMFFFGLKEFAGCFFPMWEKMNTNKVVAEMYPNDPDGGAFRGNFIPLVKAAGYKSIDGGAYADGTTDYSSMINKFKTNNAQLYSNVPLPPDFNTFWKQAAQQNFKPKLATVAKVLLFPADTTALGDLVINIATDCWWSPFTRTRRSPGRPRSSLRTVSRHRPASSGSSRSDRCIRSSRSPTQRSPPSPTRTARPTSRPSSRPSAIAASAAPWTGPRDRCPALPSSSRSACSGRRGRSSPTAWSWSTTRSTRTCR
jgi:ABC-type branched-chain amino acid transport systems, periplasmic component